MNLTRLMVLGTLSRYGPQHGHQIRRIAEVTNVGEWGGVPVGALYRELRGMEREGLLTAVRTEKVGNRPARTVYDITAEGRLELSTLREQGIRQLVSGADPLGVALSFAAHDMDAGELRTMLRARRDRLAIRRTEVAGDLERLTAKGVLDVFTAAIMRRGVLVIEAEVRWHNELDEQLARLAAFDESPDGETAADASPDGETAADASPDGETAADASAGGETAADASAGGETAADASAGGETAADETPPGELSADRGAER